MCKNISDAQAITHNTGSSSLIDRYHNMGIKVSRAEATQLMHKVRAVAQQTRRPLDNNQLIKIYGNQGN